VGKRVLFAYGLGLAGVALTVGLTLGAFALAGSSLSQPAAPVAPIFRPSHTPSQADTLGGAGEDRIKPDDDPTRSPGRGAEGKDHGWSSSGAPGGGDDHGGSSSSGSDDSGSSEGSGSDGGSGSEDNSGSGSSGEGGSDDNSGSGGGDSGSGSDDSGDD
jgi:hypothetical protein